MTDDELFARTSGPRNARIMLVGEAEGYEESQAGRPFVGESGRELDKMLAEAGIARADCFATNLVPSRPPSNDFWQWLIPNKEVPKGTESYRGVFPKDSTLQRGRERLLAQIEAIKPDLIIGLGNWPLWALTDAASVSAKKPTERNPNGFTFKTPAGITRWRGSQYLTETGRPYLPLLHPAGIMRDWPTRAPTVNDLRVRVPLALNKTWRKPAKRYLAPPSLRDIRLYFDSLDRKLERGSVELVSDIETKNRTITCIGFTTDGITALCIPFATPLAGGLGSWWSHEDECYIVRRIRAVLCHPNCLLIGQNWLYDCQYVSRWWKVPPRVHWDTMVAQHVMFPGTPKALWYLASLYATDFYCFWKDDGKEWDEKLDITRLLLYNCDDVCYTYRVYRKQRDAIIGMGLTEQLRHKHLEWSLAAEMMERGVRIDQQTRSDMTFRVSEAAAERQRRLNRMVPEHIRPPVGRTAKPWYSSANQQMRLFYDVMGLKSVHHRKTGNLTVDNTAIEEMKHRYPELTRLFETIQELRSLGVFQNTFLGAAIDPDGRMRCSNNVAGTETMRWSTSENAFGRGTNLQNIPKGDE